MEIRTPIFYAHVQEQQRQWEEERTISLLGHLMGKPMCPFKRS